MNYRMIKYILGWILLFEAFFLAVPLITALIYFESVFWFILMTAAFCIGLGLFMMAKKPDDKTLYSRDGVVIVSLSWITISLFGALPFFISGEIPTFVDALFESVSGFTTTGASILPNVETLPKALLMWRSVTHWIGGMGVLVFIMAFLPLSGAYNMNLMKAESPGPSVSKLVPRVRTTALILYSIYIALTVIEFVALLIGGMNVFDAINTAFATAGTGGFAFNNNCFGGYSPTIQIIVTVFMLIFAINFNSYYLLLRGKIKDAFNSEIRWFIFIVTLGIFAITVNIKSMFPTIEDAIRNASFTVASLVSSTGFATVDFDLWPGFAKTVLVFIMFMGACAGSTGGGIKVSRMMIFFKAMGRDVKKMIHPKKVERVTIDGRPVEDEVVTSVYSFFACYIIMFALSMLALSFENLDLTSSFTGVLTCINNMGPGMSLLGPTCNFGFLSIPSKLVLIFDMLAGRLELFPMLLLFTPTTWKK